MLQCTMNVRLCDNNLEYNTNLFTAYHDKRH